MIRAHSHFRDANEKWMKRMKKIAIPAAALAALLAFGLPRQVPDASGPLAFISASAAYADRAGRVDNRHDAIREHRVKRRGRIGAKPAGSSAGQCAVSTAMIGMSLNCLGPA